MKITKTSGARCRTLCCCLIQLWPCMSFEERMEQLGRRAIEQEPQLSLPRCIRAAEQHKPVSSIKKYRIERHGFGEGRLPIPGISIRDKVRGNNLQSPSVSLQVSAQHVIAGPVSCLASPAAGCQQQGCYQQAAAAPCRMGLARKQELSTQVRKAASTITAAGTAAGRMPCCCPAQQPTARHHGTHATCATCQL